MEEINDRITEVFNAGSPVIGRSAVVAVGTDCVSNCRPDRGCGEECHNDCGCDDDCLDCWYDR